MEKTRPMSKSTLTKAMKEAKKHANLDYAYTRGPMCCVTCSNDWLIDEHGGESTGIYAKIWDSGMNKKPWKSQTKNGININHDLTEEQRIKVKQTLEKYYEVEWDGTAAKAIHLTKEKPYSFS